MLRRYGKPPWSVAVLHGGPGAPGSVAGLARKLSAGAGVLEPIQTRLSVEDLVAELRGQLEGVVREPIVLVGHSWGAWLALLYAARYPMTARRLVLVGSGPLAASYAGRIAERRKARLTAEQNAAYEDAVAALRGEANPQLRDAAMRRLKELTEISDNCWPLPTSPKEERDALPFDARQHAAVWAEAARLRGEGELLRAAGKVRCPVTVLHGEDDPHPVAGVVEPLGEAGVKPDIHLFPRCGHCPFRERFAADAFFAALMPLLSA